MLDTPPNPKIRSRVPIFTLGRRALQGGFLSNLKDFLTERPVKLPRNAPGGVFALPQYGGGFLDNLNDLFRPLPKSVKQGVHSPMEVEWKPGYRVFWENLRDFISPPKLPPLKVTSRPVKVRDIWSPNEGFKRAQGLSLAVHALIAALLLVPIYQHFAETTQPTVKADVSVIDISPYLAKLPAGKDRAGGGGGGGERMQTQPTKGKLPKWSMTRLTPPMAVPRNLQPKLVADPSLLGPPDLKVPSPPMQNYGEPLAKLLTDSGGPGGGGGIGTGEGGGIGSGSGGGLGPGSGGGTGGGPFRSGTGGLSLAACLYCPEPKYSDEARKAKYQGSVLLDVLVSADGRPLEIRVVKSPGLGLEEKALEAVREWRFKPSLGRDGKPVTAWVIVEANFHLY